MRNQSVGAMLRAASCHRCHHGYYDNDTDAFQLVLSCLMNELHTLLGVVAG
jgi:hypothetical protein